MRPGKKQIKAGMVVLVPSNGGYAPDATDPELKRVFPGPNGRFLLAPLTGNDPGYEVDPCEMYAIDDEKLAFFLDAATGEGGALRRDSLSIEPIDLFLKGE